MTKVFFVDDRLEEVIHQWNSSGCAIDYELLPLERFDTIERTCQMVNNFNPDLVLIGYGLGKPNVNGADVTRSLRQGGYGGLIISNSGAGIEQFGQSGVVVDGFTNRNPSELKKLVDNLTKGDKNDQS